MKPFTGTPAEWDQLIADLPNAHLLQSWEWATLKTKYGWEQVPFIWEAEQTISADTPIIQAAAIILKRILPIKGFSAHICILYIPKGPVMDWSDQGLRKRVLEDLQNYAKRERSIFLKMDPDLILGVGVPNREDHREFENGSIVMDELRARKWLFSTEQIQFRNTVVIDLSPSEEEIRSSFKQKTRYNINLAGKKDVHIRPGNLDDLPLLYQMYAETSVRDGFIIRDENYYQTVWKIFMDPSGSEFCPFAKPLIAEVNGEPVGAVFIFTFASRAYYLYGMSRDIHRDKMPNYLLQWEAIKYARNNGCKSYDLWGAPDEFNEKDALWGVFRFKEGLGGSVIRTLGAWDFPVNPLLYKIYTQTLPKILNIMRLRGRSSTRRTLGS
jgi:peptidoglycan pentaglycine glycine transferase (the first glycine)